MAFKIRQNAFTAEASVRAQEANPIPLSRLEKGRRLHSPAFGASHSAHSAHRFGEGALTPNIFV